MTVVSGNIVTQPVSMADVKSVLSQSTNDLETLCKANTINMWAARKAIYNTKVGVLSADDWKGRTITGYKTGGGLKKRAYIWDDYITSMDSATGNPTSQVWDYDKPVHDGSCKFRLHDFNGYYHNVGRAFTINTLFGNISNILIPSSDGGTGRTIAFSFSFTNPMPDGGILASELFGDCWAYYPCVILTYGSGSFQYAKTADNVIAAYANTAMNINIDTADFASAIASDWRASHSGNPYANAPLTTDSKWTACLVLLSQALTSGVHKIPSSATIVRLEYASSVDRKTLPIKQTKYMNIEWMKLKITITRVSVSGSTKVYRISYIGVTAKMLSTSSISFNIGVQLSTPQGNVNVQNVASGQSVTIDGPSTYYSNVTFSGETGEIIKSLSYNETQYTNTASSAGNELCNGTFYFHNSLGDFQGTFSFNLKEDPSNPYAYSYTKEINLL